VTEVLRYDDPGAADHPLFARYATVRPGAPGRCPSCDEFGFVDHVDVVGMIQGQHCRACRTRWEYRFREDDTILEFLELDVRAERRGVIDLRDGTTPEDTGARRRASDDVGITIA